MTYLALYRKYRPKNFSEVSGQEDIVSLLTTSIKQNKVSHAYMFCGGRGTGKTTVARIFSKEVGCNDEDILEIDAASNRGIDEIRELRESIHTSPFSSTYKIYIIDEAHMLTKEAANALLKTLEEPPSHVIFILATTDSQKLPQTISSRCQVISFKEPNIATLSERLVFISKCEGFKLSNEGGLLIAKHGNGSYRDAISLLEQILNQSNKEVDDIFIKEYLGHPSFETVYKIVDCICNKDIASLSSLIDKFEEEKLSALKIYNEVILFFRNGLLLRIGEGKNLENMSHEQKNDITRLSQEHPLIISSKNLLFLLKHYELIKRIEQNSWTGCLAVFLSLVENQ